LALQLFARIHHQLHDYKYIQTGRRKIVIMSNQAEINTAFIRVSRQDLSREILIHLFQKDELILDELSQKIGVGIPDLTSVVEFLAARGFIQKATIPGLSGKTLVSLRPGENCIIGLDLGGTKLYGAVSDMTGNILVDREIKILGKTGDACLVVLIDLIEQFISEAARRNLKLQGIGVAVPGRVQLESGLVLNAPAVGMHDFPLKEQLVARFGYPVYIDNDLKQAALGETWFGPGKNHRHVVLLSIGTGIAIGALIDGRPLRGAHERLGELGWMVPGREFLGRRYVDFGALETEVSGPGIENRARRLLNGVKDQHFLDELSADTVFEAARNGEAWAVSCVAETVEYLAVLVANIMAFYDPDLIIMSGGVSRSSDLLIPPILKLVVGCVLTQPELVVSSLGYTAGALGALINLVQNCPEFLS
jgi:glucokinase